MPEIEFGRADLTNCDREPIHRPGAIQPHGVLIVCRLLDFQITHVSRNAAALIGRTAEQLLGKNVESIFRGAEASSRCDALLNDTIEGRPVYVFTAPLRGCQGVFDAIAHRSGDSLFIELEPAPADESRSSASLYHMFQRSIVGLQQSNSVQALYRICVEQAQRISGFDRVMLYRFDKDWNGEVVAEKKRDGLEPFLGLHYPASDIPRQARALYTKNWLRCIPDRSYVPSPVISLEGPEPATNLDMSSAVLRSVSPIHLEYLQNMGVGASMSISLIRDGQLWGLISCHHYSPRFVSYDVRTACEILGQMMSLNLASAERLEAADDRVEMIRIEESMLANVERFDDTVEALIGTSPNLLALFDSDGAAIVVGGTVRRLGQTPGEDDIRRLSDWLGETVHDDVFVTDNLQSYFGSGLLGSVASGLLVICITTSPLHLIIWFRTEQVRTVNWAGDPAKTVVKGDGEVRLSPRGSYSLWKQTVKGRSKPWKNAEIEVAQLLHDGMMRRLLRRNGKLKAAHVDLQIASEESERNLNSERAARTDAERISQMKDEFVATLSHELRTPLNAILGWSQILARTPGLDEEVAEGIEIIERNAQSQAKMIEDLLEVSRIVSGKLRLDMQRTDLPAVVAESIDTVKLVAKEKEIRIESLIDPLIGLETSGDPFRLQQVVWNLLSNAVKFTPRHGRIQVLLERVESHVELSITDSGQGIEPEFLPYVFERFRQADAGTNRKHGGLGLGLSIVRTLVELHGGTVRAQSPGHEQGATFIVSLPVRAVQLSTAEVDTYSRDHGVRIDSPMLNLDGVKVLVVDDEPDARQLVKRILSDSHCVVTTAASKSEAIQELSQDTFDVIISDIGMPGGDGFTLIREWREVEGKAGKPKTPAVALTAYARVEDRQRVLLAGYQAHVAKPVLADELLAIVASLAGRVA